MKGLEMKRKAIELRNLQDTDYEVYKTMFSDRAEFHGIKYDFMFENTWKKMMGETMKVWAIIDSTTKQVYGFCQLDKYNSPAPEIGVDILDGFKNKGFGQQKARFTLDLYKICTRNTYTSNL